MSREYLFVRMLRVGTFLLGAAVIVVSAGFVLEMAGEGPPWQALAAAVPMIAVGVTLCRSGLDGDSEFFEGMHDKIAMLQDYSHAYHGDDVSSDHRLEPTSHERVRNERPERMP